MSGAGQADEIVSHASPDRLTGTAACADDLPTSADDAPPPEAAAGEPLPDREQRSPLLRWTVHLGLPVSISLLLHSLLALALALSTWQAVAEREYSEGEFEVGVRDARDDLGTSLTWASEGLPTGALTIPEQQVTFDVAELSDLKAPEPLSKLDAGTDRGEGGGFGLGDAGRSGVLGVGGGAGEGGGGAGFGTGFGSGGGSPQAGVFGLSAAGNKFVYVVDFSGSVMGAVDDLKRELKRSVGRLKPTQAFTVILFYSKPRAKDELITEAFTPDLQPARADVKQRFFEWLDRKAPQGSTEPLGAMRRALKLDPECIFLFSDGYFDDKAVREIAQANRTTKARIHTLVFDELLLSDNSGAPRLTEGARRLKRIAEENGGKVKIVSGVDLKGR